MQKETHQAWISLRQNSSLSSAFSNTF